MSGRYPGESEIIKQMCLKAFHLRAVNGLVYKEIAAELTSPRTGRPVTLERARQLVHRGKSLALRSDGHPLQRYALDPGLMARGFRSEGQSASSSPTSSAMALEPEL